MTVVASGVWLMRKYLVRLALISITYIRTHQLIRDNEICLSHRCGPSPHVLADRQATPIQCLSYICVHNPRDQAQSDEDIRFSITVLDMIVEFNRNLGIIIWVIVV